MSIFTAEQKLHNILRIFPGFPNIVLEQISDQSEATRRAVEKIEHLVRRNAELAELAEALDLPAPDLFGKLQVQYENWLRSEISPEELHQLLRSGNKADTLLVDVRETWEVDCARLPSSVLLNARNQSEILARAARARHVILYCHHGVRSLYAVSYFRENGIPDARSLRGGIDQYSRECDPSIPRY